MCQGIAKRPNAIHSDRNLRVRPPAELCPVLPTRACSQADDALTLARALVNGTSGAVFTNTLLLPLLDSVYRGLRRELTENGVSVLMKQQDLELDSARATEVTNTETSDVSRPQPPTDCLMPHVLWERATANTVDAFLPREKFRGGGSMLNLQPARYLRLWEWREDKTNPIAPPVRSQCECATKSCLQR